MIRCRRDKRVKPVDGLTGLKGRVHRRLKRTIQDVPFAGKRCYVEIEYAQVALGPSSARVEQLEFVDTRCRVTRRYARMISGLCRHMSLCVVSRYTGIRWESVKEIDKQYLKETLPAQDPGSLTGLRYLGVDEVARAKGHDYLTLVYDLERGDLLWVGVGRTAQALETFLDALTPETAEGIEAVAMDMGLAYQSAVKKTYPTQILSLTAST